jgi:hypothetical protein
MKSLVAFAALTALLAPASAQAAGTSVTLTASGLTFKAILAACPGALGGASFTMGHARVVAAPGVSTQTDTTASGVDTVTFSNAKGQKATVVANGHDRSVTGKGVQVAAHRQVACILPQ